MVTGPVGASLTRMIVATVAFLMLIPWMARRVWTATEVLKWSQAELDDDVVPEDVWEAIVEVIQGESATWVDEDES